MKIFGLETTGSFTGDISGSVTSTGSFGAGVISNTLGVGTSSPRKPLHVYHPTTNIAALFQSGDSQALISFRDNSTGDDNHVMIGANGTNLVLSTDNAERIRVDEDGKVGIGTTSPDNTLHVHKGTAGSVTGNNSTTPLVVENNNHNFIQFLAPTNKSSGFYFGSPTGNYYRGEIGYDNTNDIFNFYAGEVKNLCITATKISGSVSSTGSFGAGYIDNKLGIGDSSPNAPLTILFTDNSTNAADNSSLTHSSGIYLNNESTTNESYTGVGFRSHNVDGALALVYEGSDNTGRFTFNMEGSEKLVIKSTGKVGIGTNDPQKLLHLHQANSNQLFEAVNIRTNSAGEGLALGVNADNSSYVVNSDSSNALHLGGASSTINSTGHMTIAGGGNIGIGTSSPAHKLDVVGDVRVRGDLTAATLIISSSVTQLTTQVASGST